MAQLWLSWNFQPADKIFVVQTSAGDLTESAYGSKKKKIARGWVQKQRRDAGKNVDGSA